MTTSLFSSYELGPYSLSNRIVMAPMTRSRAGQPGNVPSRLNAYYYTQRASAGLIVTEGAQISPQGQGYPWTPGIHTPEQVEGWRGVAEGFIRPEGISFCSCGMSEEFLTRSCSPRASYPSLRLPSRRQAMPLCSTSRGNPLWFPS